MSDRRLETVTEERALSEAELRTWAGILGRRAAAAGRWVSLFGELGAGKTTLVRAACRGLGIEGAVPSPTFTLVNRYESPDGLTVYHADLYRIDRVDELTDIGWPALLATDDAVFVEWAERAGPNVPPDRWEIYLSFTEDPGRRRIVARSVGHAGSIPSLAEAGVC